MQIFEDLLSKTGNQFLLATHSTVFVTPKTIKYITRIYSENQESKIHQIDEKNLPDSKHLLKVINSHNNEKLFFADLVVLVEGITDKIIFEKLFNSISDKKINYIFEVIDVGGKMMFKNYQSILKACNIRHAIIADLDYLKEIGSMQVKNLISKASKDKVVKNVLTDSSSIDGERLYNLIEDAILNNNVNDLSQNWEYIKSRQTDTVGFLDEESLEIITNFITSLYLNNEFILMRGNLEKYLIQGFKSKDVNKMIEIVTKDNFEEYFEPGSSFQELKDIANKILIQF
jgi:predicted ATP-dependent endonuclease of OLD family